MNTETWREENNAYLAVSLEWLRLQLQHALAERSAGAGEAADSDPKIIAGSGTRRADRLAEAASTRGIAAQMDPPPALVLLAQRFGLSEFERDTLLLCAAVDLDPEIPALCAQVQGNAARAFPTFGLALTALENPSWDALSPHRPLRYARLVEINQPGAMPLTASALRADERIVNYLKGLNLLDDRLTNLLHSVEPGEPLPVSESQQSVVDAILQRLRQWAAQSVLPPVQLAGPDPGSKLAVAGQACATLNRRLYRLGAEALPTNAAEVETLARLWQRESVLLPVALYVEAEAAEGAPTDASAAVQRFLSRELGLAFVGVRDTPVRLSRTDIQIDVRKPTAAEQRSAWQAAWAESAGSEEATAAAQALAGQFDLNLADLRQTAAAVTKDPHGSGSLRERAWAACRDLTRPRLDLLAQRLDPKATWNELVVPAEHEHLLRQIASQVRDRHKVYDDWGFSARMNRGMGISALFAGESGTGKTMSAEVIANDLRLNLYRIDLSAVVSKYIGETEKNLRKLFDAAEDGGAILFFDEADALFGKRSEVKDSHDRYANIEINYLLQRMEEFSGLAILATNMKSALDPAFMRRLRFIVNFKFPGLAERKLIWQKALPPETPQNGLNHERLARLNLSGGNIHSIALNAAFMAAQDGQSVTMPIVLAAARMEYRKLEKPFNETEFR